MTSAPVRAIAPAMAPPSFPEPVFYPARRIHGLVETPSNNEDDEGSGANPDDGSGRPPSLMRSHSVRGNVLLLEHPQEGIKAFLLQRKVGTSAYGGSVRAGFCLQGDKPGKDGLWHVIPKQSSTNNSSSTTTFSPRDDATEAESVSRKRHHAIMEDIKERCEMVAIHIESEMNLYGDRGEESSLSSPPGTDNLKTELSALQWIAQQSKTQRLDHLWGNAHMGNENGWICVVLSPWHSDGTLLDYITSQPNGVLGLDEAKLFFKQILQCVQQLHLVGICHRNISVDTVLIEQRHCRLSHFGSALRIPMSGDVTSTPHLIAPQPVGGFLSGPENIAPELWAQEAFDGYAVDMWSVGIILWKMIVQNVELFAAPVADDFRFREYCLEGKMKECLKPTGLPESVVDVLEGLLRVQASDRFTLEDVLAHPSLAE